MNIFNQIEKQADAYSVVFATLEHSKKQIFREKFYELVVKECDDRLSKLRGFSGTLSNGDVVDSLTWELAINSCRDEIKELLEQNIKG